MTTFEEIPQLAKLVYAIKGTKLKSSAKSEVFSHYLPKYFLCTDLSLLSAQTTQTFNF